MPQTTLNTLKYINLFNLYKNLFKEVVIVPNPDKETKAERLLNNYLVASGILCFKTILPQLVALLLKTHNLIVLKKQATLLLPKHFLQSHLQPKGHTGHTCKVLSPQNFESFAQLVEVGQKEGKGASGTVTHHPGNSGYWPKVWEAKDTPCPHWVPQISPGVRLHPLRTACLFLKVQTKTC